MVKIYPRKATEVPREKIERLKAIAPATLGHVIRSGFMDTALRPLTGTSRIRFCGPAVTLRPYGGAGHVAIDECQPGDVLVIDNGGETQLGTWGEMTSLGAKMRGVVAVIVDGPVTDVYEIIEMGLPVYSRTITALLGTPNDKADAEGEVNAVVECGGVRVHPGDLVLGDENGVVVVPPERIDELLAICEPRQAREPQVRADLLSKKPLSEISGARDRVEVVRVKEAE